METDTQWSWETSMSISLGKPSNPINVEIFQAVSANWLCSSPNNSIALIVYNLIPQSFEGKNAYFDRKRCKICKVISWNQNKSKCKMEQNTSVTLAYSWDEVARKKWCFWQRAWSVTDWSQQTCTVSVTSRYSSALKADHSPMNKGILIKTTKGMWGCDSRKIPLLSLVCRLHHRPSRLRQKKRLLQFKEQDFTLREASQMRVWALGP